MREEKEEEEGEGEKASGTRSKLRGRVSETRRRDSGNERQRISEEGVNGVGKK